MRSALSGTKRSDGRWQVVLTLTTPKGAKKRQTFYGANQAEAKENALAFLYKNGRELPPGTTVTDLIAAWRVARWPEFSDGMKRQYSWALSRIIDDLGEMHLCDLRPVDIYRWLHILQHETKVLRGNKITDQPRLSGRSLQICRNTLRVIFAYGIKIGWMDFNPARDVRISVSAAPAPRKALSTAEFGDILWFEDDPVAKDLWEFLGECGLRPSEALRATCDNIRWSNDMWWIEVKKGKNENAKRMVPIPDALANRLLNRGGYLFPNQYGQTLDYRNVTRKWYRALKRANVEKTNIYQLRKFAISQWIAAEMPDDVVKTLAGHEKIELTKNVYNRPSEARLSTNFWGQYVKRCQNSPVDSANPFGI